MYFLKATKSVGHSVRAHALVQVRAAGSQQKK